MNYLQARQRKSDEKWDFTTMRDGHISPVGYCGGLPNWDGVKGIMPDAVIEEGKKEQAPFLDRYHTHGHATAEEAQECYRRYLLDQRLRMGLKLSDQQQKCVECSAWTQGLAMIDGSTHLVLCEQHQAREVVERHFGAPGQIISS